MADNLIFPIGFDLETAVKNAEREGQAAIERLDKIFSRQPLALRMDNSGFEKYSSELSQNIDQLKTRLKDLVKEFDAIPLSQKWEENNGVKTLTTDAKRLWDELLRITEILKSVGQGAQQMANQSIREIDKEIAALEKLKQKEIEARQTKQNKQLQTEWNAAADQHKRDLLAEEKRLQEENNRMRKEAEAIAQREAEIEKLVVEYKLRQTQAQQAKKKASDEDYANLVKQLREEERLSAEKARQKALDMRRERQAEATAAIERERAARRQLFEAKRQQMLEEQRIISSQSMSYDALIAKLQVWQNIQNRTEVGSKKWEAATVAIRQTKEMLALVTEEMTKSERAAERMRKLREVLSANERTLTGLNAKLAEYNSRIQGLEVGSAKFNKTALEIRRLTEELQKATQQMQDFQQKSFQGLSDSLTKGKVQALTQLREQLRQIEADYNRLNQSGAAYNPNGGLTTAANDILRQREAIIKQINQMLSTAADAQIQREKEINRVIEQRKAKADAIAAKRKSEQAAIQANINKLKEERRILNQQESSVAAITAKLQIQQQRLQSAKFGSDAFNKAAKEVERLSKKLDEAKQKIDNLTGRTQSAASAQSAAVRQVNQEFQNQDGYVSRLLKRMAVYASFSYASQFLTNVREVTAQFELQRVSLGAIIQDQSRANQLWAEIKTFALKSPVKILDLTKYTKQVAAYGVETDKLFDTTKRIMDISVGLGVDASRLVLAYGQVKAASYLRAAEIRQFTEAGIPMLELLAEKFTELNGKAVTTEQVMDMVSKRMVGFDMVEQIFKDMTSAGGMFFDMQEKQGNTLYGLWAKLGDAASVMYDEIGNTGYINSGMKGLIQLLTDLMKNWRLVGREMAVVAGTFLLLRANTVLSAQGTALATKATNDYAVATTRLNAAQKRGAQTAAHAASLSKKAAVLNRAASISTNAWTAATLRLQAAMYSLKAAFIGNWITLAIAAVAAIGAALYSAYEKAHKLQNELKEISDAGHAESAKSVFNFERLANAALEAATGSREQKEALDELKRSYGDIIPIEQLSLENLQKMRVQGYGPLTAAIKEYIAQRTLQKEIDAITSHYTEDTIAKQRELRELFKRGSIYNFFKGVAWSPITGLDGDQVSQVFANVDKIAQDKSKSWEDVWIEAIKGVTDVSEDAEKKMRNMFVNETQNAQQQSYNNKMRDIVENTRNMADETDIATKKMETQTGSLGKYKKTLDETSKSLANLRLLYTNGKEVDASSFLGKQMVSNASIKAWKDDIVENLQDAGIEIKNGWFNIITNLNPRDASKISSIDFAPILDAVDAAKDKLGDNYVHLRDSIVNYQKLYNGIVPSDRTVAAMRSRLMQIGNNVDKTGNIMNDLQRHLMKSGDNWENYSKSVRDAVKDYEAQIDEMQKINASIKNGEKGVGPLDPSKYSDEEIKKVQLLVEALKQLFPFLAPEKSSGSGRQSDPRLQNLKEEISLTKKLYDEYHKLEKQIGATKAAEKIQEIYKNTISTLEGRAKKYGFEFKLPFTDENLEANMQHFIDKMKELQGLKDKKGKPLFPNIGKEIDEAVAQLEDVDLNSLQKAMEKKLKELADRISRTKTAKEFYEKILSQTGDVELAARVSLSIYGSTGEELFKDTVAQIREVFKSGKKDVVIDLEPVFDMTNQRIDYKMLADIYEKYQNDIIEKNRDTAQKIAQEGQKTTASNIANWQKELAKAKDFEQQRTDIIRTAAAEREKIIKEVRDPEERERLLNLSREKESQDLSKLNFEEFTKSEDYIKIFENLDNTATSTLKRLRTELQALIDTNKDLSPENMKTLVKAMEDIDEQVRERNPWESMVSSVKKYMASIKTARIARDELAKAEAEYAAQEPQLKADIETAEGEKATADADVETAERALLGIQTQMAELRAQEIVDETVLAALKQQEIVAENELVAAKTKQNQAEANVKGAVQKQAAAYKKVTNAQKKVNSTQDAAKESQNDFLKGINNTKAAVEKVQGAMESLEPLLGDLVAEGTEFGDAWSAVLNAMSTFTAIMEVVIVLQEAFNIASESNPWMAIAAAVLAVTAALASFIGAQKVKAANAELERQQAILDDLEYSYGRLEKAIEKSLGGDYVSGFRQQRELLEAEAAAYEKMADAERSKGKKADDAKVKEYEESYREVIDKIADMQGELAAQMLGTDLTSAARDFASAWLEAYKEFGNTADAMSEKFHEMVESMVVEGLLSRVMERALAPAFEMVDEMGAGDFYSRDFWAEVVRLAEEGARAADYGARTVTGFLEQAGVQLRGLGGDMTGISRDIAGASEESVTGLAAGIATQNFYIARQLTAVEAIRALLERGGLRGGTEAGTGVDLLGLSNQAMGHLAAIERHTAEAVAECREIAARCTAIAEDVHKVVVPRGVKGAYGVQTWV